MVKVDKLTGKNVLILGLARQGLAMTQFATKVGAVVRATDIRSEDQLRPSLDSLEGLPVELVLGQHPLSLLKNVDLIIVSGGVPLDLPLIRAAIEKRIALSNDSLEFMKRVPCPVIGITGSAGKTTTSALTGAIGEASGRKTWLGGNIGRPLISLIYQIENGDLVVQELSSFQLELWTMSPQVAVVLNITPNHLDRHRDMKAYTEAKANIVNHQSMEDTVILSMDDPGSSSLSQRVRGRLRFFSLSNPVEDGAFLKGNELLLRNGYQQRPICDLADIPLRGKHNVSNVLAAITAADSVGIPDDAMRRGIKTFKGVPHRLEIVATVKGVQYINDSIATAPERAVAALESFTEPLILLAGGRDKGMVWAEWAREVLDRTKGVILFGDLAEQMEIVLKEEGLNGMLIPPKIIRVSNLDEAVDAAQRLAESGDIVLLSPGGTSFDAYIDFEERGRAFRDLVQKIGSDNGENTNIHLKANGQEN